MENSSEFEALKAAYNDAVIETMKKGAQLIAAAGKGSAAQLLALEEVGIAAQRRDELEEQLRDMEANRR